MFVSIKPHYFIIPLTAPPVFSVDILFKKMPFLVTCYDSGSIARISADGKTITEYKQDREGRSFQGPNDFVAGKKGGVYFTASGPWESEPIVGKIFYMDPKG